LSATEQPPSAPEFPLEPTDNLLTQMEQIKEDFDQMFDESMQRFYSNPELEELFHRSSLYPQRVKIEENEDQYVMTLDIPIAENSEVQATVEDNILKVSGKVERVTEEREGDRVIRRETTARNFKQAIALPGPAKTDEVQTRYEEGTLTVIVPKPLDSEERDEA
nr:Hsp20/alpha crystallin family protein [Nitrospinaceae bacterium]NIR57452.1 Hsp20/alpha crystallin family protein [Nitrospinaceae bacterium]NIS87919.1 Hsp20/alpha crystallin family protein [Nitrospinaceae bacterium]NIT84787.1 Hsp20/alpha crystallin family protein [Nitrospinaceae bacterium]NIU46963.1 Hsp20/alpha crystallin family protein [Nitrospinaceae bacterium]